MNQAKPRTRAAFLSDPKALVRFNQISPHIGIGRSTFLELVRRGRAPQPVRLGRATFWVWGEVSAWRDQVITTGRGA